MIYLLIQTQMYRSAAARAVMQLLSAAWHMYYNASVQPGAALNVQGANVCSQCCCACWELPSTVGCVQHIPLSQ
jgi:hypothetical protein